MKKVFRKGEFTLLLALISFSLFRCTPDIEIEMPPETETREVIFAINDTTGLDLSLIVLTIETPTGTLNSARSSIIKLEDGMYHSEAFKFGKGDFTVINWIIYDAEGISRLRENGSVNFSVIEGKYTIAEEGAPVMLPEQIILSDRFSFVNPQVKDQIVVLPLNNEEFVSIGYEGSRTSKYSIYIKYNTKGDVIWKRMHGEGKFMYDVFAEVLNEGTIVGGTEFSLPQNDPTTYAVASVALRGIDPESGDEIFTVSHQTLVGASPDYDDSYQGYDLKGISATSDGGFVVLAQISFSTQFPYLVKFSSTGSVEWSTRVELPLAATFSVSEKLSYMDIQQDGTINILAHTSSGFPIYLQYTSSGSYIGTNDLSTSGNSEYLIYSSFNHIFATSDGGCITVTHYNDYLKLIKTDAFANVTWTKHFTDRDLFHQYYRSSMWASTGTDGEIIVTATLIDPATGKNYIKLFRITNDGEILQESQLKIGAAESAGTLSHSFKSFETSNDIYDRGIVITGNYSLPGSNDFNSWIFKIPSNDFEKFRGVNSPIELQQP